jgi:M6 family metalloprotease-like protein
MNRFKKLIVLPIALIISVFLASSVYAVPSYPGLIEYKQPNGNEIIIRQYGDEWQNFTVVVHEATEYVVKLNENGQYDYATTDANANSRIRTAPISADNPPPNNAIEGKEYAKSLPSSSKPSKPSNSISLFSSSAPDLAPDTDYEYGERTGPERMIVILVEFDPQGIVNDTLFGVRLTDEGTTESALELYDEEEPEVHWAEKIFSVNGSIPSVNDFYLENSNGQFKFLPETLPGSGNTSGVYKVTLNYEHPNTGGNSGAPNQKLVLDAMAALQDKYEFSFDEYDTDSSDEMLISSELHVMLIVAGGEASTSGATTDGTVMPSVWGHRWLAWDTDSALPQPLLDSETISAIEYTQFGELQWGSPATIGIICHELGHDVGAPDLYRSSYPAGELDDEIEPADYSVMASGSWGAADSGGYPGSSPTHFDPWDKIKLGWYETIDSPPDFLNPATSSEDYQILKVPFDEGNQYILIENRQYEGFDHGLEGTPSTAGIVVWRVDEWINGTRDNYSPNNQSRHGMTVIPKIDEDEAAYQLDDEFFLTRHTGAKDDGSVVEDGDGSTLAWMLDAAKEAAPRAYRIVEGESGGLTVKEMGEIADAADITNLGATINFTTAATDNDSNFIYNIYASTAEADVADIAALSSLKPVGTVTGNNSDTYTFDLVFSDITGWTAGSTIYYNILVDSSASMFPTGTTGGEDTYESASLSPAPAYTVTFNVINGNGSISATVDDTAITSAAAVQEGKEVIFTATPDSGYQVKEWTLDGVVVTGNVSTDYTIASLSANAIVTVEFQPIPFVSPSYYMPTYNRNRSRTASTTSAPTSTPTPTPTSAPASSPLFVADALNKLNLFVGTGTDASGKPIYELDKKLTRLEALSLVIRLMGLENESKAYTGSNTFTDVPSWGDRYAAYAYNAGITFGVNNEHTLFEPDRQVTSQEFTAFLLRVLSYAEVNGDFKYEDAVQKALTINLFSPFDISKISTDNFLRGNAVLAMADALETNVKGNDRLLLYTLSDKGVLSKEDADWFAANVK